MKKRLGKIAVIIGAIAGFLILVVTIVLLFFYYDKPLTRNLVQKYLTAKTGAKVEIGKLDYRLFPAGVRATSLRVSQEDQSGKIVVVIRELRARGQLKRLLKNAKPIFESLEIEGASIELDRPSSGKTDVDVIISGLAEALAYAKTLNLKNTSLNLSLPDAQLALREAELTLSESHRPAVYEFSLGCKSVAVTRDAGDFQFETGLTCAGTLSLSGRVSASAAVKLNSIRFATPWIKNVPGTLAFKLDAEYKAREWTVSMPDWKMDVPDLIAASGALKLNLGRNLAISLRSKFELKDLEKAVDYLRPSLPKKFASLALTGKASSEMSYEFSNRPDKKEDHLKSRARFERARLKYASPEASLESVISGRLELEGPLTGLRVAGEILASDGALTSKKLIIHDLGFRLPVDVGRKQAKSDGFKATIGSLEVPSETKSSSLQDIVLRGSANLDIATQALRLDIVEARTSTLSPLLASVKIALGPRDKKLLKLTCTKVKIPVLRAFFSARLPKELEGWEADSDCDFEVEVQDSPQIKSAWDLSVGLNLSQGKFQNAASTIAGEAVQAAIALKGRYDPSQKTVFFRGDFSMPRGESLWKDLYVDWNKYPVKARFSGNYGISSGRLGEVSLDVSVANLGEIHAQGVIGSQMPPSAALRTRARISLDSLFAFLSKGRASNQSQVEMGGELSADLEVEKKGESFSANGILGIKDGKIGNRASGLVIKGLEAALPFCLREKKGEGGEGVPPFRERGYFRAGEFETPLFKINPLELIIQGEENAFRVEPFSFGFLGGVVEIGKTYLALEPGRLSFKGDSSLRLKEIDISQLPLQSKELHLQGLARAELSRIEIDPQSLIAQGEGSIDIFGGRVSIRNVSVTRPFSPERTYGADLDLKDIDLEKLTGSVPFGKVTGILEGEIRNLKISYGQPEGFDLRLDSLKRKGVSQKFSLKAVNSMSILSSGEKAGVPSSTWWLRFVSSFGYSRIGIRSILKNDMFTLRGTIVEKGVQYLVRRSRFFGIDVINRQPEKGISFRDMIERLKKVGTQAASK